MPRQLDGVSLTRLVYVKKKKNRFHIDVTNGVSETVTAAVVATGRRVTLSKFA